MKTQPHLHANRMGSLIETGQLMISTIEYTESLSASNDITEEKDSSNNTAPAEMITDTY